jgi:error-prone DNA polymerase
MNHSYVELHCHSNYSFREGASFPEELLQRAFDLHYPALAITDHDNLCGAMEFTRAGKTLGIHPIIGAEITLKGGFHLTLLAENSQGYKNLSRLLSLSHIFNKRGEPELDTLSLSEHSSGLIAFSGCSKGEISSLLTTAPIDKVQEAVRRYLEWFGLRNFYFELQQNFVLGDTKRIHALQLLAHEMGVQLVATNNVHYHIRERSRLQDCLVAIKNHKSLDESHLDRRSNSEFFLKSAAEMNVLFRDIPEALTNTLRIADRCSFDLTQELTYRFPDHSVPLPHTADTYLEELCTQAALRQYHMVTSQIKERLQRELSLIKKHNLSGFFLMYHEIISIARKVQEDLGLVDPEIPIEEMPPGRARGSSVAMLVGYLIGLSHIDPLQYGLSLERFLPEDELASPPDIDLDFPRDIRENLIKRLHEEYGWEHAVLTGMISTYRYSGAIRDLGKVLSLPSDEVDHLVKSLDRTGSKDLRKEILELPKFHGISDGPLWNELINLVEILNGFPKYLAQHPGGMIISSSPISESVPVQKAAIKDRYICQWDKDSIDDAGFIKIDFLALGTLSQMQEILQLVRKQTGYNIDLSRINFKDEAIYNLICSADTIGIFQIESAAQIQTVTRIRPRNLVDLAHEVGAVRPGVGANDGVTKYIRRRMGKEAVSYDHPLEKSALERTYGIILFQDQVNQLAIEVAGFLPSDADQLRRAFIRRKSQTMIDSYWRKFRDGAKVNGVGEAIAARIFAKFNGQYMFPESHAFAFAVTAYQMAWLKYYYPLEFFVAIFNQQPMGFYNLETLKEDAKRHGIIILNPDISLSESRSIIEGDALRIGLLNVISLGPVAVNKIIRVRAASGPFASIADFMFRTSLNREALENLVDAGAFDAFCLDRKSLQWELGLRYRSPSIQFPLALSVTQDTPTLKRSTVWMEMQAEYRALGLYPRGHLMQEIRKRLPDNVLDSERFRLCPDSSLIRVAGLVIRRQQPLGETVFLTLEDEYGHIPLIIWPKVYKYYRQVIKSPLLIAEGIVTRREGTINLIVRRLKRLAPIPDFPKAKNWG